MELTTRRRRPRIPARKKGKSPYGKLTGCSGGLNLNPASIGSAESTDWFDRSRYFSRICTLLVPYATSTVQVLQYRVFGKGSTLGCTCGQKNNPKVWPVRPQPACMCGQKCFFRPDIFISKNTTKTGTFSIPVLVPVLPSTLDRYQYLPVRTGTGTSKLLQLYQVNYGYIRNSSPAHTNLLRTHDTLSDENGNFG